MPKSVMRDSAESLQRLDHRAPLGIAHRCKIVCRAGYVMISGAENAPGRTRLEPSLTQ